MNSNRYQRLRPETRSPRTPNHSRFMGRRRLDRTDRNGDPLDGVVNLFDVAIVLAVAFLLAALSGIGLADILAGEDMTVVKNPGQDDMQVIMRQGDKLTTLDLKAGEEVSGVGTLIGQFYQLEYGTTVYVPLDEASSTTRSRPEPTTTQPSGR